VVGAGPDEAAAHAPALVKAGGLPIRIVAVTDHFPEYAAGPNRPGTAFAHLRRSGIPAWLRDRADPGPDAGVMIVAPQWGPNMRAQPVQHVRRAAAELEDAGATLIAGHSTHVPHGPGGRTLFDLGDFMHPYGCGELGPATRACRDLVVV
jgi:poly-gamma-glutamate capsule biosynthesis protein CapA/YwtB (metallophosphatase superfamily)